MLIVFKVEEMKKRLAVYQYPWGAGVSEFEQKEYPRLSEYIEVEFVELPKETVIKNQVVSLEAEIEEIKANALEKISKLNQKKSELLALAVNHD